jgi:hypothetical protein
MNKPADIEQWAWEQANSVFGGNIFIFRSDNKMLDGVGKVAQALMAAKAEQRQADAQLVKHYIGDLIYCERIVTAIRKGGE